MIIIKRLLFLLAGYGACFALMAAIIVVGVKMSGGH